MWWSSVAILLIADDARACGPGLPSALVTEPFASVWAAPVADFRVEVAALTPPSAYPYVDIGVLDAETAALAGKGVDLDAWRGWRTGNGPRPAIPGAVPAAWVRYAEGAVLWRADDVAGATAAWRDVLALPEADRRDRVVWATYMLARADGGPEAFDTVFAAVDAGAPDPLGLASAALGERARRHLDRREWREAVDDYLAQAATGDPGAALSLDLVVRDAVATGALDAWATDEVLRRLATAWILAHGGPEPDEGEAERTRVWLRAVEAAGVTVPEADRFAWMAYQLGDIATTAAWLDRAPASALRDWIRAKLLLREGRLVEAEALLEQVAAAFPADLSWADGAVPPRTSGTVDEVPGGMRPGREAWAEAAMLRLAAEDWTGAFDAFVASERWVDVAYVAERVLTVDELVARVERLHPAPLAEGEASPSAWRGAEVAPTPQITAWLRYLLARRLLREGHGAQSLAWFPPELSASAERYVDALARADAAPTAEQRAAASWEAALLARTQGLELLGTELQPDFAMYGGEYDYMPRIEARFEPRPGDETLAPTAAEAARVAASAPDPDTRWHYRYTASALAGRAAAQLPDDDPRVPILLCRAARWHRDRDPDYANTFVRATIQRTHAWPPEPCGDPTFHPDRARNVAVAAVMGLLALVGAAWGWRRRKRSR
jgi:hypothetical protein